MKKLSKSTLPDSHNFEDFYCFGPPAKKDGEFTGTKIADFGCFCQDGSNTNKYYFACVCKSKKTSRWYVFVQFGRVGNSKYDFQFFDCDSENDAQSAYEKQCHSKNDKRGEWYDHPQLGKILRAKKNKDCYLVRNMATRISALPEASKITTKKAVKSVLSTLDKETSRLLQDLSIGTVTYAKSQFSSGMIPDLESIEEARKILGIAAKSKDKELDELTKMLYSRIPKSTGVKETIKLSSDNIVAWLNDLDAFENAYQNLESGVENISTKYQLEYLPKDKAMWNVLNRHIENSTRHRHAYIPGNIKVLNIWRVNNIPKEFYEQQKKIAQEFKGSYFPLIYEPEREALERQSNTQLLFHGTRSCNVGGILNGFRLPKELSGVAINGAVIGPGAYHASDYKKSVGYCSGVSSYWAKGSGAISGRKAFMFLNDVILGNPYVISYPQAFNTPPTGYHSVVADTNGSFQNEEFVVYDTKMFYPRYLIEFDI
jgi:hypothetical protein